MSDVITGFDGILFIGDAHLSSKRPGRRIDDYTAAGIVKLKQAARIARERNLFPVLLGDLFHRSGENDLMLIGAVANVLREFGAVPVLVGGSHDRAESWFTDNDAAKHLANFNVLKVFDTPGLAATLDIRGQRVNLWVTPHGFAVPDAVPTEAGARGIMVTHHDFDFNGLYPDAHELHEIDGCEMLVNGHMHKATPMVLKGRTACHNPGSLMRVKIDEKKHEPKVSVWTPAHGVSLEGVAIDVAKDVFDLTGKEVFAATPQELKASLPKGQRLSTFAAKLRDADSMEAERTDDGSGMVEELANYFELFEKPPVLKSYMTGLLERTMAAQGQG